MSNLFWTRCTLYALPKRSNKAVEGAVRGEMKYLTYAQHSALSQVTSGSLMKPFFKAARRCEEG